MESFRSICLEKSSKTAIYKQLGNALLSLIDEGVLKPETRLPPIRKMAECLKINTSTVVNTYKYLENKNAVYSAHGSGIYVSPASALQSDAVRFIEPDSSIAEINLKADFATTFTPHFDKRLLTELVSQSLKKDGIQRGADMALLTASFDVFAFIAKAILEKNDVVLVENPVSFNRIRPYLEYGVKLLPIPINKDGFDLTALESQIKAYKPKAIHICTYFQYPTNTCYSLDNKNRISELCSKYSIWIIEEDDCSELEDGKHVFLKTLDCRENVIYVKNLTKLWFPYICSYVCVLPKKIAAKADRISSLYANQNDLVIYEKIYELFISKYFSLTRNKISENHKLLYEKISQNLNDKLGDFIEYDKGKNGMGFWVKLKTGDSAVLANHLAKKGVLILPGGVFYGCEDSRYFRMNFKCLDPNFISDGMSTIKEVLCNSDKTNRIAVCFNIKTKSGSKPSAIVTF